MKLASVLRDKKENFIPSNTTLNQKNSNIFGSITNTFSNNLKLNYEFAIDEDFNEFNIMILMQRCLLITLLQNLTL